MAQAKFLQLATLNKKVHDSALTYETSHKENYIITYYNDRELEASSSKKLEDIKVSCAVNLLAIK